MFRKDSLPSCFALLLFCTLLVASCQKPKKIYTDTEYRHRVDSAVKEAVPTLQSQADEDLDRRLSIEVAPLADSFARK